jgi:hypothetical protein
MTLLKIMEEADLPAFTFTRFPTQRGSGPGHGIRRMRWTGSGGASHTRALFQRGSGGTAQQGSCGAPARKGGTALEPGGDSRI